MTFSWSKPKRIPLIVGHRGASAVAPENTLASFRRAIEEGADAIELDVHLTKDGEVVVIHDSSLNRTTNGRGRVREHTLNELKRLDAGCWFHKKFHSEKIPTLAEVFELLPLSIGVNIEIKADGLENKNQDITDRCIDLIKYFKREKSILISSFQYKFLTRIKLLSPELATALLYDPLHQFSESKIILAKSVGAKYIILNGRYLRKRVIGSIHTNGMMVGEYTVNTKRRFERSIHSGVDIIITDNPRKIKDFQKMFGINKPSGMRGL